MAPQFDARAGNNSSLDPNRTQRSEQSATAANKAWGAVPP